MRAPICGIAAFFNIHGRPATFRCIARGFDVDNDGANCRDFADYSDFGEQPRKNERLRIELRKRCATRPDRRRWQCRSSAPLGSWKPRGAAIAFGLGWLARSCPSPRRRPLRRRRFRVARVSLLRVAFRLAGQRRWPMPPMAGSGPAALRRPGPPANPMPNRPATLRMAPAGQGPAAEPAAARPAPRRLDDSEAAVPARLPDSPAEHFAELIDSDPLITGQPPERQVYWQYDTNEGDVLKDLKSRLQHIEEAQRQNVEGLPKKNKRFEHNLFGRIQADAATFSQDAANRDQLGNIPNGNDFRRVRLGMQGAGHDQFFYRLEVDFVQRDEVTKEPPPRLTDAYFEVRDLPWIGTLRVGQYREPYSVERLTSANDLTFLERGLPQAFHTSRNVGVMLYDHSRNDKWYWWNGIFDVRATNHGEFYSDAPRLAYVAAPTGCRGTTSRRADVIWLPSASAIRSATTPAGRAALLRRRKLICNMPALRLFRLSSAPAR